MAICKFLASKSPVKGALEYICKKEKTERRLVSGIHCFPENAEFEFQAVKNQFRKIDGRQYYHIIQSFSPDDDIDFDTAHTLGVELAQQFRGFQCVVATHKDRTHVHSHIVMNSVNYQTGKMFHQTKQELEQVKQFVNEQCRRHGLTMTEPKARRAGWPDWKKKLRRDALECLAVSCNREAFVFQMQRLDYTVKWEDHLKYVTFTTPDNHACRSHKLFDERLIKDNMETYFALGGADNPTVSKQYLGYQPPVDDGPADGLTGILDSFLNDEGLHYHREQIEIDEKTLQKYREKGKRVSQNEFVNVTEEEEYEQQHGFMMSM